MKAPKSMRLHIGIYGRRNVGKSSLLNMITRQQVSIVSEQAGTTTDPVEKPMELLPLGPVLFIDTAGIDDEGALGELRMAKTRAALDRTDVGVIVADSGWGSYERNLLEELQRRNVPVIAVFNKIDTYSPPSALCAELESLRIPVVRTNARDGNGVLDFRAALVKSAPAEFLDNPAIVSDYAAGTGDSRSARWRCDVHGR
jgi:small GTP-binding protein